MDDFRKQVQQEGQTPSDWETFLVQHYSMFYSAFKEILKLLPDKQKDLQALLKRVAEGFKFVFTQFQQKLQQMQQQNREHIKKLNETNKHLNGKFEEF